MGAGEGALPGAGADEGAISATSIYEDDDEVFEKQQHLRAGAVAVEGALSATSVHDDELSLIKQHLSHTPIVRAGGLAGAGASGDESASSFTNLYEEDDELSLIRLH